VKSGVVGCARIVQSRKLPRDVSQDSLLQEVPAHDNFQGWLVQVWREAFAPNIFQQALEAPAKRTVLDGSSLSAAGALADEIQIGGPCHAVPRPKLGIQDLNGPHGSLACLGKPRPNLEHCPDSLRRHCFHAAFRKPLAKIFL